MGKHASNAITNAVAGRLEALDQVLKDAHAYDSSTELSRLIMVLDKSQDFWQDIEEDPNLLLRFDQIDPKKFAKQLSAMAKGIADLPEPFNLDFHLAADLPWPFNGLPHLPHPSPSPSPGAHDPTALNTEAGSARI